MSKRPDWFDSSASAAIGMAAKAASRVEGDDGLAELAGKLLRLPPLKDDPEAYRRAIRVAWNGARGRRTANESIPRSDAHFLLWRAFDCAFRAMHSSDARARARDLVWGAAAAGALMHLATGPSGIGNRIDKAVRAQNARNAKQRGKAVAMREARELYEGFLRDPQRHSRPEWGTFIGFGTWAAQEYGLRADYVARKAGQWARELRRKPE
ncbi:MAG: hypothetical protein J0H15_13675 [Xanthomonadales bacterium]|nr:hypothetical protein [Xanthomonadales bacterium]